MARIVGSPISETTARRLVYALQAVLVFVFVTGLYLVNVSVVVNAALSLAVTTLPVILERDFDVHLHPVLALWITLAVVLHSLGIVGIYEAVWWWDHLTHAFSGALVAAIGYALTTMLDEYAESVSFPEPFRWLLVFLVTAAAGVCWELLELVGRELARIAGFEPLLVVYGVEDTILDLVFGLLGAVFAATLAHVGGGRALFGGFATWISRS